MIHFLFDGPPGPEGPRFIESETPDGRSINAGEWHERPDGLWELRVAVPIGINDRHGDPVHVGDTLRFDEEEWGGSDSTFKVELVDGEIVGKGVASEWNEWCEILTKFDGREVRK